MTDRDLEVVPDVRNDGHMAKEEVVAWGVEEVGDMTVPQRTPNKKKYC